MGQEGAGRCSFKIGMSLFKCIMKQAGQEQGKSVNAAQDCKKGCTDSAVREAATAAALLPSV